MAGLDRNRSMTDQHTNHEDVELDSIALISAAHQRDMDAYQAILKTTDCAACLAGVLSFRVATLLEFAHEEWDWDPPRDVLADWTADTRDDTRAPREKDT